MTTLPACLVVLVINAWNHALINNKDTKTKCRLYWCLIVHILQIQSVLLVFRPSFVNYFPSNLLSGSPPTTPNKNLGGEGASDRGQFFRKRHLALLTVILIFLRLKYSITDNGYFVMFLWYLNSSVPFTNRSIEKIKLYTIWIYCMGVLSILIFKVDEVTVFRKKQVLQLLYR
jgi:hypothetical protein